MKTGRLNVSIGKAIVQAADEVIEGEFADQFPVDPIQRWCRYFCKYEYERSVG